MLVAFIIFAVLSLAIFGYGIYKTVTLIKGEMIEVNIKKVVKEILIYVAVSMVTFVLALVFSIKALNISPDGLHWFKLIAGGILFGALFPLAIHAFILFYYGKNIPQKWNKSFYIFFMCAFVASFFTLFLWADGYAPYIEYPLINGISFENGFVRPGEGRLNLAWYAICILSGALLVYFMCDHFMYKEYGEHGILESTFLVAFPAGIIGARIWYCIGESVPFEDWIRIWDGGLTILGGATMGILVGVLWFIWRNKKYSIWVAIDVIVPTILIAQAVGRFGNFFNCEVHGELTSIENFKWLPEIIVNNMTYSESLGFAPDGQMFVPLFLIEGFVNFFGYFLLAHLFGKKLAKFEEQGDLCFGYIAWYGLTRVIMEPLRNAHYNMGDGGYWSWIWSLLFVLGGCLAILANHLIRYLLKKKHKKYVVQKGDKEIGLIESVCFGVIGLGLVIAGIILMSKGTFAEVIGFNQFNIGLMLLIVGLSVLVYVPISMLRFVEAKKYVAQ